MWLKACSARKRPTKLNKFRDAFPVLAKQGGVVHKFLTTDVGAVAGDMAEPAGGLFGRLKDAAGGLVDKAKDALDGDDK